MSVWRYPVCEMLEMPRVDIYFDGIGAFEILDQNVRLIPYKLVPGQTCMSIEYAFVRPLLGWAESIEHAQQVLQGMPVPKPDFLIKRLGH